MLPYPITTNSHGINRERSFQLYYSRTVFSTNLGNDRSAIIVFLWRIYLRDNKKKKKKKREGDIERKEIEKVTKIFSEDEFIEERKAYQMRGFSISTKSKNLAGLANRKIPEQRTSGSCDISRISLFLSLSSSPFFVFYILYFYIINNCFFLYILFLEDYSS